jgi:hypothetical protein
VTRLAGALAATVYCVVCAQADEVHPWPLGYQGPAGYESAILEGHPWTDAAAPPLQDDAYVFADVVHGSSLSPDVIAAAVRFDVERMTRAGAGAFRNAQTPNLSGRVALAFNRFVPVGKNGLTYASVEVASGRGGPASLSSQANLERSVLAMTSPKR